MPLCIPSISGESALRTEIYARTLELPEPERWFARDNDHRWRLASALQKSVRRGHTHCATKFAAQLHSIDPVYAWRRLCVIALEDCFGDPLAAALTLEANRSFRFRQQLGELKVLAAVTTGLAEGTKSRAICDSLVARGKEYQHPPAKLFKAHAKLQGLPWLLQYLTLHGLSHAQLGYEAPVLPHVILLPAASSTLLPNHASRLLPGAGSSGLDSIFHFTSSTQGRLPARRAGRSCSSIPTVTSCVSSFISQINR